MSQIILSVSKRVDLVGNNVVPAPSWLSPFALSDWHYYIHLLKIKVIFKRVVTPPRPKSQWGKCFAHAVWTNGIIWALVLSLQPSGAECYQGKHAWPTAAQHPTTGYSYWVPSVPRPPPGKKTRETPGEAARDLKIAERTEDSEETEQMSTDQTDQKAVQAQSRKFSGLCHFRLEVRFPPYQIKILHQENEMLGREAVSQPSPCHSSFLWAGYFFFNYDLERWALNHESPHLLSEVVQPRKRCPTTSPVVCQA